MNCPFCHSPHIRLEPMRPQKSFRLFDRLPFLRRKPRPGRYVLTCRNCGRQTEVDV